MPIKLLCLSSKPALLCVLKDLLGLCKPRFCFARLSANKRRKKGGWECKATETNKQKTNPKTCEFLFVPPKLPVGLLTACFEHRPSIASSPGKQQFCPAEPSIQFSWYLQNQLDHPPGIQLVPSSRDREAPLLCFQIVTTPSCLFILSVLMEAASWNCYPSDLGRGWQTTAWGLNPACCLFL